MENLKLVFDTVIEGHIDTQEGADFANWDDESDLVWAVSEVVKWIEEDARERVPDHIPTSQVEKFLKKEGEKDEGN